MNFNDDHDLLLVPLLRRRQKRKIRHARRWWVHPIFQQRQHFGTYYTLFQELKLYPPKFFNYTRMSVKTFDYLLRLVEPSLNRQCAIRIPICAEQRLAITLRYLAIGDSMVSLSYSFRVSATSVSRIIREVCEVLWAVLSPKQFPPFSIEKWMSIATGFEITCNFPNCTGAIDGKHIVMQCPPGAGSQYFNYKKDHSIVLLGIADSTYKFIAVNIGAYGRQGDSSVFNNSEFGNEILNGTMRLPNPKALYPDGPALPYVFVGDEAFPLQVNLMRPFPGRNTGNLPLPKRIFNYRLSSAWRVVENSFGILSSRWRILRRIIVASVETVEAITKATICLHNLLMNMNSSQYCPPTYVDHKVNGEFVMGEWRMDSESYRQDLGPYPHHNFRAVAHEVREAYMSYFLNEGACEAIHSCQPHKLGNVYR